MGWNLHAAEAAYSQFELAFTDVLNMADTMGVPPGLFSKKCPKRHGRTEGSSLSILMEMLKAIGLPTGVQDLPDDVVEVTFQAIKAFWNIINDDD